MTSKQKTEGNNSHNVASNRDTQVASRDIINYNLPENTHILSKSNLASIVKILIDKYIENFDESLNFDNKDLPVQDMEKIDYNNIVLFKQRFLLVADTSSVQSLSDVLNDIENPAELNSVIKLVIFTYQETLNNAPYYKNHTEFSKLSMQEKNYDDILMKMHEKLRVQITSSSIVHELDVGQIDSSIDLIIYHVFRLCYILEKPPSNQ